MAKYLVEGTMSIPEFWDVDLDYVLDEQDAKGEARKWVENTYPEAFDVEITDVKALD